MRGTRHALFVILACLATLGFIATADEGAVVETVAVIGKDFSADSNGTKRYALTEYESAGLAKLFDSVDVDGSGAVDYLELASFLRAMSTLDDDLAAAISPKMVYEVFRRSDDDGDGRLSGAEFGAALVAWSAEEWADVDDWADVDGPHSPAKDTDGSGDDDDDDETKDPREYLEWEWAVGVASAECVLCVTGHPTNCGPPSPPGCEVPESRAAGLAVAERRAHAAMLGDFLRKRGLTHE